MLHQLNIDGSRYATRKGAGSISLMPTSCERLEAGLHECIGADWGLHPTGPSLIITGVSRVGLDL
jgi:hypothetical protein